MRAARGATGAQLAVYRVRSSGSAHGAIHWDDSGAPRSSGKRSLIEVTRAWVLLVIIVSVVGGYVLGAAVTALSSTDLPACETEDSVSCYWDGDTMGNGRGLSFINDSDGKSHYLTK